MLYFIQVIIYSGIFWALYQLILKRKNSFSFNRFYLLAFALLPFILPLIKLPGDTLRTSGIEYDLPEIITSQASSATAIQSLNYLLIAYCIVTLILVVKKTSACIALYKRTKRGERKSDSSYALISNSGIGPGSFGKYVFFPGNEIAPKILEHELVHIHLKHSWDVVFTDILLAFGWFNLFLFFIKKELQQIHEFQADEIAAINKEEYCLLLLRSTFHAPKQFSIHSFNIHPLKRRIMMLEKKGSAVSLKPALLTILSSLLIFSGILVLQSCVKARKKTDSQAATANEQVLTHVEKMPEFPGGDNARINYLIANLKYPIAAMEQKIVGRVTVKFVVSETGKIKDATVVKSPSDLLSAEALSVVNAMPDWIPGENGGKKVSVYFTLPIAFQL